MAGRPVSMIGTGKVRQMLLLPRLARRITGRRDGIGRVVQPAMPFGRNARGFGNAVVDHPALAPQPWNGALVEVVTIALAIRADEFATHLGEEPGADSHGPTTLS